MRKVSRLLQHALAVVLLTVLTQVGGIVYLLHLPLAAAIRKRVPRRRFSLPVRLLTFLALLTVVSTLVLPPLAKRFQGRVPLPLYATDATPLQPANWFTVLANRHYVRPALYELATSTARGVARERPGTRVTYLDGNFPFLNGFPLLPHLSHDDGRKLDLALLYQDDEGRPVNGSPTYFGYGHYEGPGPGEKNRTAKCLLAGYWQYDFTKYLAWFPADDRFDAAGTRLLLRALHEKPATGKILLEPHLIARLNLSDYGKIRFHGCQAVRHDDHIHVQL